MKGFTLPEMLIAIILIGILAAIATPSLLNQRDKATIARVLTEMDTAKEAIAEYGAKNGEFPPDQTPDIRPPQIPASVWPDIRGIDYENWSLGRGHCIAQITWFGLNTRRETPAYTTGAEGDDKIKSIAVYDCSNPRGSVR